VTTQVQRGTKLKRDYSKKSLFQSYLWVISFLAPYRFQVCLFIICSLFIVAVEMSIPRFIQYFIDVILPGKDIKLLLYLLTILAGLLAIMFCITIFRNRMQLIIQEKAIRDLKYTLFEKLREVGFSYYERHPVGETLSLFNSEAMAVQQVYSRYFPSMVINSVMLIVAAYFMLSINITLSLIVIPCFLSYYLIGPYFEKKAAMYARESQKQRNAFNKKIYDSVSSLLELRANGSEEWDLQQIQDNQGVLHQSLLKQYFMNYSRGLVRRVLIQFGAVAVFAYSAYLVKIGEISVGAVVAFSLYYFLVIGYMTFIVTNLSEQTILMHQAERLVQFMEEQAEISEPEEPVGLDKVSGHITFRNVHFHYPSQTDVIQGFNLDIHAGEKVAFVGTSGNGKSTLLKLIGRFYDPQQGDILLDGVPLNRLSLSQVRESLGFVFQETYLFGTTVKENIRFGRPEATDEEIVDAAKAAFAHAFIMELPQGYDTFVGERGIKLSGGQKQRLAIARMFIKNPRIVVLDEATSALDNISEWEVQLALENLFKGRTTLAVAHRLSTIKNFDRIVVVEQGCNMEMGTYKQLMNRKGSFYHLAQGKEEKLYG
jgi:ATP-binding cassette subfamily B protein/subfamily B ATP-binding cassette protein MsbA